MPTKLITINDIGVLVDPAGAAASGVAAEQARAMAAEALLVPKTTTVNGHALNGNITVVAGDVTNTPAGNISATTVQAAINELDGEKAGLALNNVFTAAQAITLGVTSVTNAKSVTGSVNNFFEQNIQNLSPGASASSDFVATTNTGSETSEYVDLGINGSGYSGAWGAAKDGYLYASDNNLWIGTSAAGKTLSLSTGTAGVTAEVTIASTGVTLNHALPVGSGGTGVTTSTGSGSAVLSTSPTLVTPALGTPSSGTLTSCTGLPISTGVSGLAAGVATFLATPSSANLKAAITDETGSGSAVFATSPTLVTPILGTPISGDLSNCTATTLAATISTTAPATTAFVQGVQQAEFTIPTALSVTTATDYPVAAVTAQNRYETQRVSVTAGTYVATVTLQSTNARAGDKRRLLVSMPAGLGNQVQIRNLTSSGTLLATVPMDGALARNWTGYSTFDGTNWGTMSFSPESVEEYTFAQHLDKWYAGGYLNSDGATSNRAQVQGPFDATNNPRGWVAGAASLTWRGVVTVPTSNSSTYWMAILSQAGTNSGVYRIEIYVGSDGSLIITQAGTVNNVDYRQFINSQFRATYGGQTGILEIYFTQGTTSPIVRWNDVNISSSFLLQTGGTIPAWLDTNMVPTYHSIGLNWPSGPAPVGCWILGSLTDADRAFHRSTGKYPAWVVVGGTCVGQTSGTLVIGRQYIIQSYLGSDVFTNVGAASNATGVVFTATGTTPTTWTSATVIRQLGALSLPGIQPIGVVDDLTTIGGNQASLLGVTPVTDKRDWRICTDTWTSGNQQILTNPVVDSTVDVIDSIEQTTTGTVTTVTVGSASGGAQYKASASIASGINPTTLVTRQLASNNIWVGAGAATKIRTCIKGHRAN